MSVFRAAHLERPFPLTMMFFEILGELAADVGSDVELGAVVMSALRESGCCDTPDQDAVRYACSRLMELQQNTKTEAGSSEDKGEKHFGTQFANWVTGMAPDETCLYITDYDWDKAYQLYTGVDREDVNWMLQQKMTRDWNEAMLRYEACLFGFGGGYGKGSGENVKEYDSKKDQKAFEAGLKSMGF